MPTTSKQGNSVRVEKYTSWLKNFQSWRSPTRGGGRLRRNTHPYRVLGPPLCLRSTKCLVQRWLRLRDKHCGCLEVSHTTEDDRCRNPSSKEGRMPQDDKHTHWLSGLSKRYCKLVQNKCKNFTISGKQLWSTRTDTFVCFLFCFFFFSETGFPV